MNTAPMLGFRVSIRRVDDHPRNCCPGHTPLGDPRVGRRSVKRRETRAWRREVAPYLRTGSAR